MKQHLFTKLAGWQPEMAVRAMLYSLLLLPATVAATPATQALQPNTSQPVAVATIQQLMRDFIDPNIDPLWEAVSTETGPQGTIDKVPRTDEEWQQLKRHALTLAEVANLLQIPHREVAHEETSSHASELSAAAIATQINQHSAAFTAHAQQLQRSTLRLIEAIEQRDVSRYEQIGGEIEHSCEACHSQFWYPGDRVPSANHSKK